MSNSYYYYLDQNVFASLQHSQEYYDNFFNELLKLETYLKIDSRNGEFITTPFCVIEYLGIKKSRRLKPNRDIITEFIEMQKPEEAFLNFVRFSSVFYDSEIDNYHLYLLEENRKKIESSNFKPYMKVLWDGLVTNELLKDDFKTRLFESLRWDYITDWIQEMPNNRYKINTSAITSEILNYGMNNVYVDSINFLRLVKAFYSHVDFKEFRIEHKELNDQIILIEKRRNSLLGSGETKPAGRDLIDMDINQLSVTGYKANEKSVLPVISFTMDATDKIHDRIYALKDILGIYYKKAIIPAHKQWIENFKPGVIARLGRFTKIAPSMLEEIMEIETINETWLGIF